MKDSGFYVDVEKARRLGVIGRIKVSINGRRVDKVVAAKSGRNGFLEFFTMRVVGDDIEINKMRGNVKISVAH